MTNQRDPPLDLTITSMCSKVLTALLGRMVTLNKECRLLALKEDLKSKPTPSPRSLHSLVL